MVLYEAYQLQRDITAPARAIAALATWALGEMPESWTTNALVRQVSANLQEMIERARLTPRTAAPSTSTRCASAT